MLRRFKEVPSCILCLLSEEATKKCCRVLPFESFTRKEKPVTNLSVQDAEEQGKGRKEQEEGKERERRLEEGARLQGGRPRVCPGKVIKERRKNPNPKIG